MAQLASNEPARPITWSVTAGFPALLEQRRISLVLSTRPDHVMFLGAVDGTLTASATMIAHPLGLAVTPERIAVATARTIVVFANAARLAAHYPGRPDYYDAFFIPRTLHFTGGCHMHDMEFHGDAIIAANTNFSCVCRVDGAFSFTPLWRPWFISRLRPEDRCHLNGFAGEAGELRYLTALAMSDAAEGWRDQPMRAGILIDARANTVLRSDLCLPHSPRIVGERLYVLNGGEGQLLRIDRGTGAATILAALPGFAHGLCAHGGVLFVGMSSDRVSRRGEPPPVASRHDSLIAGVAAVDEISGKVLGQLEFTSGVTEVYDVQVLPGVRRAAMQNILGLDGYIGVETPESVHWMQRPDNDTQHLWDVAGSDQYSVRAKSTLSIGIEN